MEYLHYLINEWKVTNLRAMALVYRPIHQSRWAILKYVFAYKQANYIFVSAQSSWSRHEPVACFSHSAHFGRFRTPSNLYLLFDVHLHLTFCDAAVHLLLRKCYRETTKFIKWHLSNVWFKHIWRTQFQGDHSSIRNFQTLCCVRL